MGNRVFGLPGELQFLQDMKELPLMTRSSRHPTFCTTAEELGMLLNWVGNESLNIHHSP